MISRRGSDKRARQHLVSVRFSDIEWKKVQARAALARNSVTGYVRETAVHRDPIPEIEVVSELRRLAALQTQLHSEGGGFGTPEYAQVLLAITNAIERIAADGIAES